MLSTNSCSSKERLEFDIRMILDTLSKKDPECTAIIKMHMQGYNIKGICTKLGMSRFKVKKRLDKGLKFIKEIVLKDGIIVLRGGK